MSATSAFSTETAVATAHTYAWEGTDLAVFTAASPAGNASVSYLFDESDRPYAAAVSLTPGGSEDTLSVAIRLLTNDHGDILALADASGEVFARYSYGPFGEAEGAESRATALLSASEAALIAKIQPLRYAGYCYDTWSGDYYLQARYYDPETKQFLSKDPDKADGEESAYQYCSGDPVNAVDPTGEFAVLAVLADLAIGAAISAALYGVCLAGESFWKTRHSYGKGKSLGAGLSATWGQIKKDFSWKQLGIEMAVGAVTQGVGGLVAKGAGKLISSAPVRSVAAKAWSSISARMSGRTIGRGLVSVGSTVAKTWRAAATIGGVPAYGISRYERQQLITRVAPRVAGRWALSSSPRAGFVARRVGVRAVRETVRWGAGGLAGMGAKAYWTRD